ncbi:hypothetical protein AX16_010814 [Volvariella volvacea WC 439]|nr:hypothetical protein AX16_010814 [Volvariella volvacea WC 439]
MLHQLPAEVLQIIARLVNNSDLCTLSTLCHTLHVVSLSTLFSRTKTFEPLSTRCLGPVSKGGPPIKLFHKSHGLCISLESDENLNVLHGLRLSLPYMFDKLSITAVSLISLASSRVDPIFQSSSQVAINPSTLHTLNIQSSFIFHPLFINNASSMFLQCSDSLHSLLLDCITISYWEWSSVLACISLPRLKELYLGRSRIKWGPLLNFLLRHRSIELLDLGHCNSPIREGRPPGLLPKLKTLKATENIILHYFLPPIAPSKPQFITIISLAGNILIGWLSFWRCLRTLYTSDPGFTYTLQIRVEAQFPTEWLPLAGEGIEVLNLDASVVRTIMSIEIYSWEVPTLLETREIRSDLVSWLEIFPEVVTVDVVGCNAMDEASWIELCVLVKAKVPRMESFRVDGRDLNTSTE